MASERNRISNLTQYLTSLDIEVNIGKNKARGNKGLFKVSHQKFRIDISKNLSEDIILRTLVHEFAHFLHYSYDKTLKSLEFIFDSDWGNYIEELIELTVDLIPKTSIAPLFEQKELIKKEIKHLTDKIKNTYPDFIASKPDKVLEQKIAKDGYKCLLKHDKVRYFTLTGIKLLSIDNAKTDGIAKNYLELKSKQRMQRRISSRISTLNKYYNSTTELWARAFEHYVFEPEKTKKIAPNIYNKIEEKILTNKIKELQPIIKIAKS